ncbi:hypothetical protein QTP88_005851 [Uroleucon formosanum]
MNPVERFLTFVPNCGHTGIEMANTLITFLDYHEIELIDCHGQSYDNAANMSGKYQDMQALIENKNEFAEFVPCSERFDLTSHLLQDPKIILQTAVNALNYLLSFVREIRNKYEEYEEKAKEMSGSKDYAQIHH